jgi:hypothetical protein
MSSGQYAGEMLDYLYNDGDIDIIFFGQILGVVSYDDEDKPFAKSKKQRLDDAIKLAVYLLESNDFSMGEMIKPKTGLSYFSPYTFEKRSPQTIFQEKFSNCEDIDDLNKTIEIVFKKNIKNKPAPKIIPENLLEIFK